MQFQDGKILNAVFSKGIASLGSMASLPELDVHLLNRPDLPSAGYGPAKRQSSRSPRPSPMPCRRAIGWRVRGDADSTGADKEPELGNLCELFRPRLQMAVEELQHRGFGVFLISVSEAVTGPRTLQVMHWLVLPPTNRCHVRGLVGLLAIAATDGRHRSVARICEILPSDCTETAY